jgi:hypothetical protein
MPERTTSSLVTFLHPFSLAGIDETQPAGTYTVETVDEQLETLSFVAYRRLSTTMELPAAGSAACQRQITQIDSADLAQAQERDLRNR